MDIRRCVRPGCPAPAGAVLTYVYASRTVWLDLPGGESDATAAWGLCDSHARSLKVPVGWECDDRRAAIIPVVPIRPSVVV